MRVALGFALAPIAPALLAIGLLIAIRPILPPNSRVEGYLVMTVFSPVFAVPATVLFAIPMYAWLRCRGRVRLNQLLIIGAVVSLIVFTAVTERFLAGLISNNHSPISLWNEVKQLTGTALLFGGHGLLIAFTFWIVALWGAES
jgi:hypothetical protein